MARCGKRNYMDELRDIICAIENTKPEPEVCNARCPPLGCPKGPCIGMCCYRGACDACCVSQMPCCPPPPEPPYCCAPPCSSATSTTRPRCKNPFSTTAASKCLQPGDHRGAAIARCPARRGSYN